MQAIEVWSRQSKNVCQQSGVELLESAPSKAPKYKRANCTSSSASHAGALKPPDATRFSTAWLTWRYSQLNHFRPSPSLQLASIVCRVCKTSAMDCGEVLTAAARTGS